MISFQKHRTPLVVFFQKHHTGGFLPKTALDFNELPSRGFLPKTSHSSRGFLPKKQRLILASFPSRGFLPKTSHPSRDFLPKIVAPPLPMVYFQKHHTPPVRRRPSPCPAPVRSVPACRLSPSPATIRVAAGPSAQALRPRPGAHAAAPSPWPPSATPCRVPPPLRPRVAAPVPGRRPRRCAILAPPLRPLPARSRGRPGCQPAPLLHR